MSNPRNTMHSLEIPVVRQAIITSTVCPTSVTPCIVWRFLSLHRHSSPVLHVQPPSRHAERECRYTGNRHKYCISSPTLHPIDSLGITVVRHIHWYSLSVWMRMAYTTRQVVHPCCFKGNRLFFFFFFFFKWSEPE